MNPSETLADFGERERPGAIIGGRYEILRILGEGGMGAVYEARDRELDRIVAFKVIRSDLVGNSEILTMFKQELVLARQVTHRNVVRIYDLGTADGLHFITMVRRRTGSKVSDSQKGQASAPGSGRDHAQSAGRA